MTTLAQRNLLHIAFVAMCAWLLQIPGDKVHWVPAIYFIRLFLGIIILDGRGAYFDKTIHAWFGISNVFGAIPPLYFLATETGLHVVETATCVVVAIESVLYTLWFHEQFKPREASPSRTAPAFDPTSLRDIATNDVPVGHMCVVCRMERGANDRGEAWCRLPRCEHVYHRQCVLPWLDTHNTCPHCRQSQSD